MPRKTPVHVHSTVDLKPPRRFDLLSQRTKIPKGVHVRQASDPLLKAYQDRLELVGSSATTMAQARAPRHFPA